ncbi:MAG: hypothetical protein WCK05_10875 [Planctomycetota bacterium]|jgi:hypothetical protein
MVKGLTPMRLHTPSPMDYVGSTKPIRVNALAFCQPPIHDAPEP